MSTIMHGNHCVIGSGKQKSEIRNVGSFTNLTALGSVSVRITMGDDSFVRVSGDDNIIQFVETKVVGDGLDVGLKTGSYITKVPLIVDVGISKLCSVKSAGSGGINVYKLSADKFSAYVLGSGDMCLYGDADIGVFNVCGSGDIDGSNFRVQHADVKVVGSGDVDLKVTGSANLRVTGSGNIRIVGDPDIKQGKVRGSGSIKFM